MLELLFGNENIERVLFFLVANDTCYGKQIADRFSISVGYTQRSLEKLERAGILATQLVGRTRLYSFNPRYAFLDELKAFLSKAYSTLPIEMKEKYYEPIIRQRPRRQGKPI